MNEINSLIIFTKASQMLAEADTIQKVKELKNLALTAAEGIKEVVYMMGEIPPGERPLRLNIGNGNQLVDCN